MILHQKCSCLFLSSSRQEHSNHNFILGETDWKLITIDTKDPLADQLNDIADVEKHFPGLLKGTIEWFKIYKIPDGKPENQFAFNGEAKPAAYAYNIVEEVMDSSSFCIPCLMTRFCRYMASGSSS